MSVKERAVVWQAAADLARSGTRAGLATVARHRGSLPMASDAKMLVTREGRWGTVGGGCVEADVTEKALAVAAAGLPQFVRHTLNADVAGDIGLSCGGTAEFFLEPLLAEMADLYASVAHGIESRSPTTVLTGVDWNHGARKTVVVGDQMISIGQPFGPTVEAASGTDPISVDEEHGTVIERIRRVPRVIIFGAGHVGAEIAKVAAGAGFHVVIIDDRERFANRDRVPWAHEVFAEDFRTVLTRFAFDEDDFVLATTRGHSYDAYVVEHTAGTRAGYVGMLGSKRKRSVILRSLERAGIPRERLKRVRSPIGIEIGADTPAEIAVSVVAEMIRMRRYAES